MAGHVNDPRFARLQTDPRFHRVPKKERKGVVDDRFSAVFNDRAFQAPVSDHYGRRLVHKEAKATTAESQEFKNVAAGKESKRQKVGQGRPKQARKANAALPPLQQPAQMAKTATTTLPTKKKLKELLPPGEVDVIDEEQVHDNNAMGVVSDLDDDEGECDGEEVMTESATSSDEELDEEESSALVRWLAENDNVRRIEDGTHRLAVVHCNWDQIRAVDLLAVLGSFVPAGGAILSVAVYPSDLGEERMAEEATMGPTGLLKRRQKQLQESDEENADDEEEGEEETSDPTGMNENLRRYELDRLKYYYAVVSCDCVATAESIYASCDGAEFEDSSLKLDLRFIADDMVFEKSPRDIAKDLPTKYSAPSFMCSALQQSKPTLSWDTDDTARVATMRRDLSKAEVREMEYAAYIASESSEDSDAAVEEYAFPGENPPHKPKRSGEGVQQVRSGDDREVDEEMDMQMTFVAKPTDTSGQGTREGSRAGSRAGDAAPSVFEQEGAKRKRKCRERKRLRKLLLEGGGGDGEGAPREEESAREETVAADVDDMPGDISGDAFFVEAMSERDGNDSVTYEGGRQHEKPSNRGGTAERLGKGKAGRKMSGKKDKLRQSKHGGQEVDPEEAKREAELGLLMLGDDEKDGREARRGYVMKDLLLKQRSGRGKRGKEIAASAEVLADEDFNLDLSDTRFGSIYTSSDFAIDPTHPKYRKTEASEKLLRETQQRHSGAQGKRKEAVAVDTVGDGRGVAADGLWSLASSLKAKTTKAGWNAGHAVKDGKVR